MFGGAVKAESRNLRDPLNLIRLAPSKGETAATTVPGLYMKGTVLFLLAKKRGDMAEEYNCLRCGKEYPWEQLTQTKEGNLFCAECWQQVTTERKRNCPVDNSEMEKHLVCDVVLIDTCLKCGGTWFDQGELDIIRKRWN